MKNAVLLTGISAATLLLATPTKAQHTAAGVTTTISAANAVNQSQQAPARDPNFARVYGNAAADRQARSQQQRQRQAPQPAPGVTVVRTPQQQAGAVATPQQQQPATPARDANFARVYGSAAADRQARSQQQQQRQPQAAEAANGQPVAGQPTAAALVVYRAPVKRGPDPEQEKRIVEFQRQKAISGNPTSQYDLGMRYLKGDGVEKDREQALSWLNMSAKGGNTRAKRQLDKMSKQTSSAPESK